MTTNSTVKTVTRKIGLNRGKRRIWLENKVLIDANINHGLRFNVTNSANILTITIAENGARKIAGKPNRPIIDMSGATITDSFSDAVTAVSVIPTATGLQLIGITQ